MYCIMLLTTKLKEMKRMSATIKEIKTDTEQFINLLKQLPETKQEFINGYVQGISEILADKNKSA